MGIPGNLPIQGLAGKAPSFGSISIKFPNDGGSFSFPSIGDIKSQLTTKHFDPGSPGFVLNNDPNVSFDYEQKLDDFSKKTIDAAQEKVDAIIKVQEKNLEVMNKIDLSKLRTLTADSTPVYKAVDADGAKQIFESTSKEIDDAVETIYQKHIQTCTNAVFDKVKDVTAWTESLGFPIDMTMPTIPGLDGVSMPDMLTDPKAVYTAMEEKLADKQSAFSQWIDANMPTGPDESVMEFPAVDIRNKVKVAQTKYTSMVTDYMGSKMQAIQDTVNSALDSLVISPISIEVPTLPTMPTAEEVRSYVTGKAKAPPPFDEPIPDPALDIKFDKQDADSKMSSFYQNAQNKIAEGVMGYYDSLLNAIPVISIPMPSVSTNIDIFSGSVSITGP